MGRIICASVCSGSEGPSRVPSGRKTLWLLVNGTNQGSHVTASAGQESRLDPPLRAGGVICAPFNFQDARLSGQLKNTELLRPWERGGGSPWASLTQEGTQ